MITLREIGQRAQEIVVEGAITAPEVRRALTDVAAVKARLSEFDLLADVRGHPAFGLSALAAETRQLPAVFGLLGALDRVALVADAEWIKRIGKVESLLLFRLDYRTFDRDQYDAARLWVLRQE